MCDIHRGPNGLSIRRPLAALIELFREIVAHAPHPLSRPRWFNQKFFLVYLPHETRLFPFRFAKSSEYRFAFVFHLQTRLCAKSPGECLLPLTHVKTARKKNLFFVSFASSSLSLWYYYAFPIFAVVLCVYCIKQENNRMENKCRPTLSLYFASM